jgi:hypothetical protein
MRPSRNIPNVPENAPIVSCPHSSFWCAGRASAHSDPGELHADCGVSDVLLAVGRQGRCPRPRWVSCRTTWRRRSGRQVESRMARADPIGGQSNTTGWARVPSRTAHRCGPIAGQGTLARPAERARPGIPARNTTRRRRPEPRTRPRRRPRPRAHLRRQCSASVSRQRSSQRARPASTRRPVGPDGVTPATGAALMWPADGPSADGRSTPRCTRRAPCPDDASVLIRACVAAAPSRDEWARRHAGARGDRAWPRRYAVMACCGDTPTPAPPSDRCSTTRLAMRVLVSAPGAGHPGMDPGCERLALRVSRRRAEGRQDEATIANVYGLQHRVCRRLGDHPDRRRDRGQR